MKSSALHQNTERIALFVVCVTHKIMNFGLNDLHFSHLTVNWLHFTSFQSKIDSDYKISTNSLFFSTKSLKTDTSAAAHRQINAQNSNRNGGENEKNENWTYPSRYYCQWFPSLCWICTARFTLDQVMEIVKRKLQISTEQIQTARVKSE